MAQIPTNENTTLHQVGLAVISKQEDWRRNHLGASVIGHPCKRALWYSFRWCKEPKFSERQLRLFARGQREEDVFVGLLRAAGVTVVTHDENTGDQYRVSAHFGHFGGSLDGACIGLIESPKRWHVTEFKTHNAKSFKSLITGGVQKSKPQHYTQMQIYMNLTGMERAYYMAVSKDDDSLYAERVHYDKDHATESLQKADDIIFSATPPLGISPNADWYECSWCDYHALCFENIIPRKSCRTCLHVTPLKAAHGAWHCELSAQMGEPCRLTPADQRAGCDNHLFIPALVPAEVVDASESENWVRYVTPDGRAFTNCSSNFPGNGVYPSEKLEGISLHTAYEVSR